jgi:ketosteroid isomerase-like protein
MYTNILAVRLIILLTCALWLQANNAFASTTGSTQPNQTNAANTKVLAAVDQLRRAIAIGDAAMAERSMAVNVSIFEQGHAEKSRAEYMNHHFKEDVAFAKVIPTIIVSTDVMIEGNIALVTAHTTSDGTFNMKPIKNAGVETYVLRQRNGNWQIEHIHWSSRKRP